MHGVGGWYRGNGAKVTFSVDSDPNRVDFTGTEATVSGWKFLGFIDTIGFSRVDVREADEGGGETKIFFSDDFILAAEEGPGTLQFSASNDSVAENGTSIAIEVTRSGGSAGAITVAYSTTDGTATAGSDYTAASGTLNFADGDVSETFTVTILDDTDYEGNETFVAALAGATGGAAIGTPGSATITINENDAQPPAGSLQFDNASYSVAENAASVLVTVTRTGGSFGAVSVDYASTDGTATASSDYTAKSGTLNFADGVLSQNFSVPILDDTNYEGDEAFSLNLSNAQGSATIGAPSGATVTITENDPVPPAGSLQFGSATYGVAENGASVLVTVTRTGGSFGEVGVNYATSDGSAAAGSDYTATSNTLTFADGIVSQSFSITILDDTTYEGDEGFQVGLSGVTGGATVGTPSTTSVTITEDDSPPSAGSLQFSGASYSVAEDGTSVLVTVTRNGGSFGAVSVDYASTDGSAAAGSDYSAAIGTLNFADGDVSESFTVSILDDTNYEGDEDFSIALSNPQNGASVGTPASATVTITEDDPVPPAGSLQFSGTSYSVAENGTSVQITVTRSGGSFGAVSVDYASSNGTATGGSDYTPVNSTLNFADGVMSGTFTVTILDDTNYEGNETFNLSLSNAQGGGSLGTPASATVTITEDDAVPPGGSLQLSGTSYSAAENGASVLVTVTRTGGSFGAVSVDYASSNGTATGGSDYTPVNSTLNFADGVMSGTFTVTILDDTNYEGNETFNLSLSNAQGGGSLGTPASATVTITEDDVVPPAGSLQFSGASYSVAEDGTSLLVTVTRSGGSFGAVSVAYSSSDGTATANSDYTPMNGTLNFADGVMSQTFSVSIINDSNYEGNEAFGLSLSNPQGGASLGTPSSATVTITEDDAEPPAGSLRFSSATYTVAENVASVQITVTRSGGSFGAVSVDYLTVDGTASAAIDYQVASGTLNFADGDASESFTVTVLDDLDYEGDEDFSINLSNATGGASIGTPSSTGVTISENDAPPPAGELAFNSAAYTIVENGASVTLTVARSGGSAGAISVSYAAVDGTAIAGSDYTATSGTLNFADGDMSESFTVAILDDVNYEGDETFNVSLSNAQGGATVGAPASATVTINEDDAAPTAGSLQLSGAAYAVAENAANVLISVNRIGGSFGAVTVDYATANGSATAGQDFSSSAATLSFADGQTSATFTVPMLDDLIYEGDESFTVSLQNPTGGAALDTPSSAVVTIAENDSPPPSGSLQFSGAGYSASEADGVVTVTVTRSGGSAGTVSADYATSDVSAVAGSDYTALSGTLTFADGVLSQSVSITIDDDAAFEGDEMFAVALSNPQGGATLGTPATANVTIAEDDTPPAAGVLQFSAATYSAAENAASVRITVERSGGSAGQVSVEYATSNGTATSGSDFTALSGTLMFADGETSRSIDVTVLDDTSDESNETFTVSLSAVAGGATLGAMVDATVTITDNDQQNQPPKRKKKGGGAMSPVMLLLVMVAILLSPAAGIAGEESSDPHANHKKIMESKSTHARSTHAYDLDGIGVTKSDSTKTTLAELISDDKPVMVHFIFTTCTTICPVQAATFSQVQQKLGDEASEVQMVSVSIDPEYDTPARLQDYAKKFRAGPQWDFLTGTSEQMIQVQKAFDAYEGNKMSHKALTLIKGAGAAEWVRLEGLISASDILEEYQRLKSSS